jgi:DNA-binding MarR family transcriptional regulator
MSALDALLASRPAPPPLGEVLDFMRLLWAVDHALQSRSKRMESRIGVTGPQRLVLRLVGRFPGILPGQVARLLHIHPSTLSGILKRLEARRLVRRRRDVRDRRRTLLWLTARGTRIDELRQGTIEATVGRVVERVPAAKLDAVRDVLTEIGRALDAAPG